MSRIFYLAKAVVVVWLASVSFPAWAAGGYIVDYSGVVYIAVGKNPARSVVKHDAITSDTVIWTGGNSHAVLKFEDGQVISIQSGSTFQVREYVYDPQNMENSAIILSMFKGGMHFVTGIIGQRNPAAFRLATPNATIRIKGTDFFSVLTSNGLYNKVLSGRISVTNRLGESVFSGEQVGFTATPSTLSVSVPPATVPADIFSQLAAIPVPPAVPGPIPLPEPIPVPVAGGSAPGGASAATEGAAGAGVSAVDIAIGLGVAAGVAVIVNQSTTHH